MNGAKGRPVARSNSSSRSDNKRHFIDKLGTAAYIFVPLFLLLICSSSCAIPKRVARETRRLGGKFSLQVAIADDANHNQPIAVDLVLVKDEKLMKSLAEMPASAWFQKREQVLRDNGKKVEVVSWEWVPGQVVSEVEVNIIPSVTGGVIFARYSTPGDHRAVVTTFGPSQLSLDKEDISYQQRKG